MVRLVVVGAGGLVGRRVVNILDKDPIPDLRLYLTGRSESIGRWNTEGKPDYPYELSLLKKADIVLLCTPGETRLNLYRP